MLEGNIEDSYMPVHFVILSVISGIIGLVLSGFTAYHLYLTSRNTTTIESFEKNRYLSPLRSHVTQRLHDLENATYANNDDHSLGEQLRDLGNTITEIHANALPGVLRPEEGEEVISPAQASLQRNIDVEAQREQRQYDEYLDERDSQRLPNAFNLGWRRNLRAVFGPSPLLWGLPICNSIGDGWHWEMNEKFKREREHLRREREREREQMARNGWDAQTAVAAPPASRGRDSPYANDVDSSNEDEEAGEANKLLKPNGYKNWNDVPDEMLASGRKGRIMK
jgi:palmitoyltransferase ZDHHC2/15/20